MAGPVVVDARGLRCPWPVLRLARAMRDLPADGAGARLHADDPATGRELAALAIAQDWLVVEEAAGQFLVRCKVAAVRS